MSGRRVSCSWARARLELLPGADLPAGSAALLRAHLVDCRQCRARLHPVLRARRALIAGVPPDALPAGAGPEVAVDRGFFTAMHRAIMAQVRGGPDPVARVPGWRRVGPAVFAAALFLLGVGLTAFWPRPRVSLLERPPVEVGRPAGGEGPASLTVTVGHEPRQGLMGRRKARRELRLEVPGSGR